MFQNLQVISPEADALTRYTPGYDWKVSFEQSSVPVTRDEISALAKQFVLVFAPESPSYPLALLGLEGKNAYLTKEGEWDADTIPARLAIYPFSSVLIDGKAQLARAADAANFKDADGEALYDARGIGTDLLQSMTMAVARSHMGVMQAMRLTAELENAGVLKNAQVSFSLADGSVRTINGYRIVDDIALAALDAAARAQLEQSGAMALVIEHRNSLANVARLAAEVQFVPAKAPRKRAAASKAIAPRAPAKRAAAPKVAAESTEKPKRAAKPKVKAATPEVVAEAPAKRTRKPVAAKEKASAA